MKTKILLLFVISMFFPKFVLAQGNTDATYHVYSMVTADSHLYLATDAEVIDYNFTEGKCCLTSLPDGESGLSPKSMVCGNGDVYVGFSDGHIYMLKDNGLKYLYSMPETSLNQLCLDSNGTLYACGRSLYKRTDTGWSQYILPDSEISSTHAIYSMCADKAGCIWLGARLVSGGAYKYKNEQIELLNDKTGAIMAVASDNAGNVWMGSAAKGLFEFKKDVQTNNYTNVNSSLKDKTITAMCVDETGTLWLGRNYLQQYADGDFVSYPMPDGLSITCMTHCDGMLYLGTNAGLYTFVNGEIKPVNRGTSDVSLSSLPKPGQSGVYNLQGVRLDASSANTANRLYIKDGKVLLRR